MSKFEQSKEYFDRTIEDYAEEIMSIQPDFYSNTAKLLNKELKNSKKVLDIGNGGILNYQFHHLDELVCADLSVSKKAVKHYLKYGNISFKQSNILDLKLFENHSFDTIIIQAVIHHLAGPSVKSTELNLERAMRACRRVLKPGGQILIVESTVSGWFEKIERLFYPFMQMFFKICRFGAVYQYSGKSLKMRLSKMGYTVAEFSPIDVGPSIWVMGKKVPTVLTPCGAVWIKIKG